MRFQAAFSPVLFVAACGSPMTPTTMMAPANDTVGGVELIAGFHPPKPGANQTVFVSPVIPGIKPGTDVTYCSYIDLSFSQTSDVVDFRMYQSNGGHHAILYGARKHMPSDTHVCTEDDMVNASQFIAGGGAESMAQANFKIPDGLAFTVIGGSQLMIQTHWISTGSTMVDGQAVLYMTTQPSDGTRQTLDLLTVYTTQFNVPAQQTGSVVTTCKVKDDIQLLTLVGHEHEWGSRVKVEVINGTGTVNNVWEHAWQPAFQTDPPLNLYSKDKPFVLHAGDTMRVTCDWNNTTDTALTFPREMCVGSGFYFPSRGELDCGDGNW